MKSVRYDDDTPGVDGPDIGTGCAWLSVVALFVVVVFILVIVIIAVAKTGEL